MQQQMRPDRSDAHLPPEEAARIEQETRRYFQTISPKRPAKPPRSEASADQQRYDGDGDGDLSIPELQKLQDLQANPQRLVCEGGGGEAAAEEEYVETEYYKDLNCIDKQHHTTGTGFIRVDNVASDSQGFDLTPVSHSPAYPERSAYRANPATNEWIPSADPVIPVSNKPSRSDT